MSESKQDQSVIDVAPEEPSDAPILQQQPDDNVPKLTPGCYLRARGQQFLIVRHANNSPNESALNGALIVCPRENPNQFHVIESTEDGGLRIGQNKAIPSKIDGVEWQTPTGTTSVWYRWPTPRALAGKYIREKDNTALLVIPGTEGRPTIVRLDRGHGPITAGTAIECNDRNEVTVSGFTMAGSSTPERITWFKQEPGGTHATSTWRRVQSAPMWNQPTQAPASTNHSTLIRISDVDPDQEEDAESARDTIVSIQSLRTRVVKDGLMKPTTLSFIRSGQDFHWEWKGAVQKPAGMTPPAQDEEADGSRPFGSESEDGQWVWTSELGFETEGWTVARVSEAGQAARFGVKPGYIIREIDGEVVENDDEEVKEALECDAASSFHNATKTEIEFLKPNVHKYRNLWFYLMWILIGIVVVGALVYGIYRATDNTPPLDLQHLPQKEKELIEGDRQEEVGKLGDMGRPEDIKFSKGMGQNQCSVCLASQQDKDLFMPAEHDRDLKGHWAWVGSETTDGMQCSTCRGSGKASGMATALLAAIGGGGAPACTECEGTGVAQPPEESPDEAADWENPALFNWQWRSPHYCCKVCLRTVVSQALNDSSKPVKNGHNRGIYCPACTSDGPAPSSHIEHKKCYKDAKRTEHWPEYDAGLLPAQEWPEGASHEHARDYLEAKERCESEDLGKWVKKDPHAKCVSEPPQKPGETSEDGEWRDEKWEFSRAEPKNAFSDDGQWKWERNTQPKPRGYMGKATGKNLLRVGGTLKFLVKEGVLTKEEALRMDDIQLENVPGLGAERTGPIARRAREEEESALILAASTMKCPGCEVPTSHYRGHGCHAIRCNATRCTFHGEWCYLCGGTRDQPKNGCNNHPHIHSFCGPDCNCPPCPDCRPGHGCARCTGHGCRVCAGTEPPGAS